MLDYTWTQGRYQYLLRALIVFVLLVMTGLFLNQSWQNIHPRHPKNAEIIKLLYDDTTLDNLSSSGIQQGSSDNFTLRKFVIWNNDLHSSPIEDLKHFLSPLGVEVIHFAMDSRCQRYFQTDCRSSNEIKILNRDNILDMNDDVIQKFYEAYKDDPIMKSVDAFVCFHPPAICELFLPFNRSILVVASTRYAGARPEAQRWTLWNQRLSTLAELPRHLVAANNKYDVEYMQYYSGIKAELLPSFCSYTNATYQPSFNAFLLYAGRYPQTKHAQYFEKEWTEACALKNCSGLNVSHVGRAFGASHSFQQLASYKGIIHIPYQVSTMSLFEQYRMGIPLFFPSLDLLSELDHTYDFVNERNCKDFRRCYADDVIASVPPHPSQAELPDPHNKSSLHAVKYWLQFSDFYQWPHITYFDSVSDLIDKLHMTDFSEVSRRMQRYNAELGSALLQKWKEILQRIASYRTEQ